MVLKHKKKKEIQIVMNSLIVYKNDKVTLPRFW